MKLYCYDKTRALQNSNTFLQCLTKIL